MAEDVRHVCIQPSGQLWGHFAPFLYCRGQHGIALSRGLWNKGSRHEGVDVDSVSFHHDDRDEESEAMATITFLFLQRSGNGPFGQAMHVVATCDLDQHLSFRRSAVA